MDDVIVFSLPSTEPTKGETVSWTPVPRRPPLSQEDLTQPSAEEFRAIRTILTRALAVYNGRRAPYIIGANIGTEAGIKSINRSAAARRVLYKGETDAKFTRMHITRTEVHGRSKIARYRFTVAAVITTGARARAVSASIVETPKGLKIDAFNAIHR